MEMMPSQSSEDHRLIEIQSVKTRLRRFQLGTRLLVTVGQLAICVQFARKIFFTLLLSRDYGDREQGEQTNLAEKI